MQTLNSYILICKKQLKLIIIFLSVYLLGIIIGVFFNNTSNSTSIIYLNATNYHVLIFNSAISPFKVICDCLLSGILLSITIIVFGFSKYTIYLETIIIFYRGIILGTSAIIFFQLSKFSGAITFIILTLPSHLIITLGLIFASALNNDCQNKPNKSFYVYKHCLTSILFTIASVIYVFLILVTVIRPINTFFWINFIFLLKPL